MCQILYEPYKLLNIIVVSRLLPVADSSHLICICMQTLMVDHMAETVDLLSIEFTLLLLEVELELVDFVEYKRKMFLVLIYRITVDEYIIEIGMQENAYEISENHRHCVLKRGGGVTVPNLHCMAHVCAIYCGKCTLVYILGHCQNLFVHVGEVNLRLYLHSRYVQVNLILVWEQHNILYGVVILFTHINRGAQ